MKRFISTTIVITLVVFGATPVLASHESDAPMPADTESPTETRTKTQDGGSVDGTSDRDGDARVAQATSVDSNCHINGEPVPCDEIFGDWGWAIGAGFIVFLLGFVVITIAVLIFWLLMLIHSIRHPVPNQQTWIIIHIVALLIGLALISAIAYYFAVKRPYDKGTQSGPQDGNNQSGGSAPRGDSAPDAESTADTNSNMSPSDGGDE